MDGHEGHHGLGDQGLRPVREIRHVRFGDDDLLPLANDTGSADQGIAMGRSQEVDFELNGEDLVLLGNRCKRGVSGRVIRHGGHDAGVDESILLTDVKVGAGSTIQRCVLDKHSKIGANSVIGAVTEGEPAIAMVGKNSIIPEGMSIGAGSLIGPDVIPNDFSGLVVESGAYVQTRRLPNEL